MKKFLAAGFAISLLLSACSGSMSAGEGSPKPALTDPVPSVPAMTEDVPESTATILPPTESPDTACSEVSGVIEKYEIPWKDDTLSGRIYLPPCYRLDPDRDYPTLYMLHGATETDQQWDDLGLNEWADTLISENSIPPMIIIMPMEITWIVLPENPFGDDLVKAVIPWIDSHYQTRVSRDYRAIGGMSRGGNWAVRLGLMHWGLFGSIGAHSTPLFIGDLKRVPGWVEIIPASKSPRILMDIGEGDNNLADAEALHESLLDQDIDHEWRMYPGLHDEHYWRSHLGEYLEWYSSGWAE